VSVFRKEQKVEKFKTLIRQMGSFRRGLINEIRLDLDIPWEDRIRSYLKGFISKNYLLYDLKHNNSKHYVNDISRDLKTIRLNRYYHILDNKLEFQTVLGSMAPLPELYGIIMDGAVIPLPEFSGIENIDNLIKLARDVNGLVIKPMFGGGGEGIIRIEFIDGKMFVDEKEASTENLKNLLSRAQGYMVTRLIHQADYATKVFPDSTNCLRIQTMIDPHNGEAFIASAVQKFGSSHSKPTDNWSQGGACSLINLETGELSRAASKDDKGRLKWYDKHPETDAQITGIKVDHWGKVRDGVLDIAQKADFLIYVGWDLVVTKDSFVILEGNNYSGLALFQVHEPLLKNKRIKDFYKYHKVI